MKTWRIRCVCALWLWANSAFAHELQGNRLTLVMREPKHITLTFLIDYIDVLKRALSPQSSEQEFAVTCASMTPVAFQKALLQAQQKFQADSKVILSGGKQARISHWQWPAPKVVQARLQELVMQALVAPAAHGHSEAFEVRAEIKSTHPLLAIRLALPEEFRPTTIVSYRPTQVLLQPKAAASSITFSAPPP